MNIEKVSPHTLALRRCACRGAFPIQPWWLFIAPCVQVGILVVGGMLHSPTPDEIAHLPSGVHHLETARFELARANPPLVRTVAAIPVYLVGYVADWRSFDPSPGARSELNVGADFLDANGERSFFLFTLARWACIPFALIGGYVCWRWASELYGRGAGTLALVLFCFCPTVLGNAMFMTPDVACASFGVLAGYTFWRWLREATWGRAVAAGIALGVANVTKGTWLILLPLWPLLLVFWTFMDKRPELARLAPRRILQVLAVLGISVLVINTAYLFDGTCTPLGDFEFTSALLGGHHRDEPRHPRTAASRFRGTALHRVPVPLPKQFVMGMDTQWTAFERGRPAFLLGEWKDGGWWYYYIVAMAVKIPLGAWALFGVTVVARAQSWSLDRRSSEVVLLAPAIASLAFISAKTGINRHFRYVLPALPFIYVWLGSTAQGLAQRSGPWRAVVCGSAGWFVASSLLVLPHSASYFNELCGGPVGGSRVLLGSSVEWGQDLLFLKRWVECHPDATPLYVAWYPTSAPPRLAGLKFGVPPESPVPAWYAVTLNTLYAPGSPCAYLRDFRPIDRVAYSVNIYQLTDEDIFRWRAPREGAAGPGPGPPMLENEE